ncbi:MAG: trehalose-phosphatase [Nitrososphaerales archaeon]
MEPKHLLNEWQNMVNLLKASSSLFILLDFDGTLTPIVRRPQEAYLSTETKQLLKILADNPRFQIAIVSGRMLNDVKERVGLEGLYYAGNHGLQITGPNLNFTHPKAEKLVDSIEKLANSLKSVLSGIEGVIVENKIFTISVHYRLTPLEKIGWVKKKVLNEANQFQQILVTQGKKVLEVKPSVDWNKGEAARFLVKSVAPASLPIYAGDDNTDEDAFIKLKEGVTILVAEEFKKTNAKYYLRNTDEVQDLLRRLANL